MFIKKKYILINIFVIIYIFLNFSVFAQNLPGSADTSRIKLFEKSITFEHPPDQFSIPKIESLKNIPNDAQKVHFTLKQIKLKGVTAFKESEFLNIYKPYMNKKILLDRVWKIADEITQHYQVKGYILSRAYIPEQEIESGIVIIQIAEGSIAEVNIEDAYLTKNALVQRLIQRIKDKKPLHTHDLDSFMLQMNDLPGQEFKSFIEPIADREEGYVRLLLKPQKEVGKGAVSFNNFGSRFLGPHQASVIYQDSFIPLQETTISFLASTPTDELKYGSFRHNIPLYPDWNLGLFADYVTANPGVSLKLNNVQSDSINLGLNIDWQPIRQREENLIASLEFGGKNTNGDILNNNPLTRDRIRTFKGELSYDTKDNWNGYNYNVFSVNQGVGFWGASKAEEDFLSRSEADSNFTTAQFHYTRQQFIDDNFMAIGQIAGQIASGPLFSAEEFGYGGQNFGLAYDPSEITGDHGLVAGLELRYLTIDSWQKISFVPYSFYDIGKVWNEDIDGINESGSSAGLGIRLKHDLGFSGNIGLAWPLTTDIGTPIYGNGKNPRILFQIMYGF